MVNKHYEAGWTYFLTHRKNFAPSLAFSETALTEWGLGFAAAMSESISPDNGYFSFEDTLIYCGIEGALLDKLITVIETFFERSPELQYFKIRGRA